MSTFHFRSYTAAPLLGRLSLGKSLDALVGQAQALSTTTQAGVRTTALDLNGDGVGDAQLQEYLDADGKVTGRNLTETASGDTFTASDANCDGKIDAFGRSDASGGYWVRDTDGNGVADQQNEWGKTTDHFFMDTNGDGKADYRQDTRRAFRKDHFTPAPEVPSAAGVQLGSDIRAAIPQGAKEISWSEGKDSVNRAWDVNGDWLSDVQETQTLDANRNVVRTQVTLDLLSNDSQDQLVVSDANADGKIDQEVFYDANGVLGLFDVDGNGKLDGQEIGRNDGSGKYLQDLDGDGKVDQVTTWSTMS